MHHVHTTTTPQGQYSLPYTITLYFVYHKLYTRTPFTNIRFHYSSLPYNIHNAQIIYNPTNTLDFVYNNIITHDPASTRQTSHAHTGMQGAAHEAWHVGRGKRLANAKRLEKFYSLLELTWPWKNTSRQCWRVRMIAWTGLCSIEIMGDVRTSWALSSIKWPRPDITPLVTLEDAKYKDKAERLGGEY